MFEVLDRTIFFVSIMNSNLLKCFVSFFTMSVEGYKVFGFVLVRIRTRSDGGIFFLGRKPLFEGPWLKTTARFQFLFS